MVGLTSDNIHIPFLLGLGFRVSCGEGDIGDGAPSGGERLHRNYMGHLARGILHPTPSAASITCSYRTGSGGSMQRRRTTTE